MILHNDDCQIGRLSIHSTALVTDALRRLGVSDAWPIGLSRRSQPGTRVAGRAVILNYAPVGDRPRPRMPGQFEILEGLRPGDVVLYAAKGVEAWLIGENISTFAASRGLAGLAVDGGARDVDNLANLHLPIFSRYKSAKPYATELWLESLNQPTMFATASVKPGDAVLADSDGMVIVPAGIIDDVLYELDELTVIEANAAKAIVLGRDAEHLSGITDLKGRRRPRPT